MNQFSKQFIFLLTLLVFFSIAKTASAANINFTLSAWVNPTTSIASKAIIVKNNELRLVTDASGNPVCQIHNGTAWQTAASSNTALSLSSWQFVSCAYDGQNIRVYINGEQKGSQAMTENVANTANVIWFGDDAAGTYGNFSGSLDDIRIYKTARSATQIMLDYETGPPPVAYWKMDEKTGTTVQDSSGNAKTGTIRDCPRGWVLAPGSSTYGTSNFCVMQYEAKNVSGRAVSQTSDSPWVSITQTAAITACSNIGGHLITNNEWMTIARNAEQVASNWSNVEVGNGVLARGWAANTSYGDSWTNTAVAPSTGSSCLYNTAANTCGSTGTHLYRRTLTLSNGETIWDISGNVWEWTNNAIACAAAQCTTDEMPYDATPNSEWIEFTAINTYGQLSYDQIRPSNISWNSTQGMGRLYTDYDAAYPSGNTHAFIRGGLWSSGALAGAFALDLSFAPSYSTSGIGFRCAR